jgi:hypothetical protein
MGRIIEFIGIVVFVGIFLVGLWQTTKFIFSKKDMEK